MDIEAIILISAIVFTALFASFVTKRVVDDGWRAKEQATIEAAQKLHDKDVAAAEQIAADNAADTAREKALLDVSLAHADALAAIIAHQEPIYVTKVADAKCVVPVGFVRLTDAAAQGVDPSSGPASARPASNDDPSGVALSDIAKRDDANAAIANACRDQVIGLLKHDASVQAWWAKTKPLCNGH
jgi:hypothetical protein